jgi:hypothetical protein
LDEDYGAQSAAAGESNGASAWIAAERGSTGARDVVRRGRDVHAIDSERWNTESIKPERVDRIGRVQARTPEVFAAHHDRLNRIS